MNGQWLSITSEGLLEFRTQFVPSRGNFCAGKVNQDEASQSPQSDLSSNRLGGFAGQRDRVFRGPLGTGDIDIDGG